LVTISLTLLLVGGAVGFASFNNRQQLIAAAKQVQSVMTTARTKARAGDRPSGCGRLLGYQVTAAAGTSSLTLTADCSSTDIVDSTTQLNEKVAFDAALDITFRVLHGGVNAPATITLSHGTDQYQFTVSAGGEISEGGLL